MQTADRRDHGVEARGLFAHRHLRSQANCRQRIPRTVRHDPHQVPGMQFSELLPRQAAIADKFTVLRSMHQTAGGHPAGSMQMFRAIPTRATNPSRNFPIGCR